MLREIDFFLNCVVRFVRKSLRTFSCCFKNVYLTALYLRNILSQCKFTFSCYYYIRLQLILGVNNIKRHKLDRTEILTLSQK